MFSRLSHLLHINNILVSEQYGFRKVISINHAAFRLQDSILECSNKNMQLGAIFFDLAQVLTT
jgi:hypothetical protein